MLASIAIFTTLIGYSSRIAANFIDMTQKSQLRLQLAFGVDNTSEYLVEQ